MNFYRAWYDSTTEPLYERFFSKRDSRWYNAQLQWILLWIACWVYRCPSFFQLCKSPSRSFCSVICCIAGVIPDTVYTVIRLSSKGSVHHTTSSLLFGCVICDVDEKCQWPCPLGSVSSRFQIQKRFKKKLKKGTIWSLHVCLYVCMRPLLRLDFSISALIWECFDLKAKKAVIFLHKGYIVKHVPMWFGLLHPIAFSVPTHLHQKNRKKKEPTSFSSKKSQVKKMRSHFFNILI